MNSFLKYAGIFIAGILVSLAISAVVVGSHGDQLGGVYNQVQKYFPSGINVGSGTDIAKVQTGLVNCTGAATVAASQQATYDCAIAGVASGDKVFMTLPNANPTGIFLSGAYASTTASGYVEMELGNASTTAIAPVGTTSVQYLILR